MKKSLFLIAVLAITAGCTGSNKNIRYTSSAEQPFFNISEITAKHNITNVFGATPVFDTYENGKGVLEFDRDVKMIGEGAFANCTPIETVSLPGSVTSIGSYAFFNCSKLQKVTIPEYVARIGYSAFLSCGNLKEVRIEAVNPPATVSYADTRWDGFEGSSDALRIYVPEKSLEAYKTAEGWKDYAARIVGF